MNFTGAAKNTVKRDTGHTVCGRRSAGVLLGEEITRIAAKFVRKNNGRRRKPECIVKLMFADYRRLNSCAKVGTLHGTTAANVFSLFKKHGYKINPRKRGPVRVHNGIRYTQTKDGYWRATIRGNKNWQPNTPEMLHKAIWTTANGPIPPGHHVAFKDGDKNNCSLENLFCAPIAQVSIHQHRRHYPDRQNWTPEDRRRHKSEVYKRYYDRISAQNRARGLTTRGKLPKATIRGRERKEWNFVYIPPRVVREDRDHKVVRRHVARFSPKGALGDLFREIHGKEAA